MYKPPLTVTVPINTWDDIKGKITELEEQLRVARKVPCEWCVGTTNLIESQGAQIEELESKLEKEI